MITSISLAPNLSNYASAFNYSLSSLYALDSSSSFDSNFLLCSYLIYLYPKPASKKQGNEIKQGRHVDIVSKYPSSLGVFSGFNLYFSIRKPITDDVNDAIIDYEKKNTATEVPLYFFSTTVYNIYITGELHPLASKYSNNRPNIES
jgi:hypothetical protein